MNKSLLERNGKILLLAYDQGFEHGPADFDKGTGGERAYDPNFILKIAKESGVYTGIVFQEGIAQKYYQNWEYRSSLPLVVKLNGKTSFHQDEEPLSLQLCTVEKAVKLGAAAVGYTIYIGSEHEEQMMAEFSRIEDEAHEKGLAVIAWMYPRGRHVKGKETAREVVAYAARIGLELGADMVKVPYTGEMESFKWVVKSAGKTGVLVQGGKKMGWEELGAEVEGAIKAGAKGVAIGRNVWQAEKPVEVSKKLAELVYR
ncbi:aldolase [Candidatus Collierbacteria bacterium]|nr:aldolase [Candidatus Collierbacteria bacterium]